MSRYISIILEIFGVIEKRYVDCINTISLKNMNKTQVKVCVGKNFNKVKDSFQYAI